MSKSSLNPEPSASRRWIYSGIVILLVGLVLILTKLGGSEKSKPDESNGYEASEQSSLPSLAPSLDTTAGAGELQRRTRSTLRKTDASENPVSGQFPLVERILSDTSRTDLEAAAELSGIARRTDIALDERFEALAHGMNLDFNSFAGFAAEPDLPVELAQPYLDELLNQNRTPILQIEGCIALLDHPDQEIREQAAEQLAFMVEKESLVESPDELKQAAAEKLEDLRKNPPVDSTADVADEDSELAPK